MEQRTIHPLVREALDEWWAGIEPILGGRIRSVVLTGSGAAGDFAPAVSDIDIYVIVEPPLQRGETGPVEAWHEPKSRMQKGTPGAWREAMEAQYLTLALIADPVSPHEYLSIRPRSPMWATRNMSPFSRYTVIRHGWVYRGQPVTFAPAPEADLLANIEREMIRWRDSGDGKLTDTRWMADKVNRMARYLAFLEDGADLTKTEARERGVKAGGPFADACRGALRYRQVGEEIGPDDRRTLAAGFAAVRIPVARRVGGLLGARRARQG